MTSTCPITKLDLRQHSRSFLLLVTLLACLGISQQTNASIVYTLRGTASGLASGQSVVLLASSSSWGGSTVSNTVNSNGLYAPFSSSVVPSSTYTVSVQTQPTGQTCSIANATGVANANVTNINVTCGNNTDSGSTPGGTVSTGITGGGFVSGSTQFSAPSNPPSGYSFPYDVISFTASTTPGGTISVTLTYPNALPSGTKYWKQISGNWVDWTNNVTISGNTIVLTLTDGAYGDTNAAAGLISDPSGPGVGTTSVPLLSDWTRVGLSLSLLALLIWYWKKNGQTQLRVCLFVIQQKRMAIHHRLMSLRLRVIG